MADDIQCFVVGSDDSDAAIYNEGISIIGDAVGTCCQMVGNERYADVLYCDIVQIPTSVDITQGASMITNYITTVMNASERVWFGASHAI